MKFYTPILSLPAALENYLLCQSLFLVNMYMPNNLLKIFLKLIDEVYTQCIGQEHIGPSSVDNMRSFLQGVRRSMIHLVSSSCWHPLQIVC